MDHFTIKLFIFSVWIHIMTVTFLYLLGTSINEILHYQKRNNWHILFLQNKGQSNALKLLLCAGVVCIFVWRPCLIYLLCGSLLVFSFHFLFLITEKSPKASCTQFETWWIMDLSLYPRASTAKTKSWEHCFCASI